MWTATNLYATVLIQAGSGWIIRYESNRDGADLCDSGFFLTTHVHVLVALMWNKVDGLGYRVRLKVLLKGLTLVVLRAFDGHLYVSG